MVKQLSGSVLKFRTLPKNWDPSRKHTKRSGSSPPNKPSNEMTESNDPDGEGPALLRF